MNHIRAGRGVTPLGIVLAGAVQYESQQVLDEGSKPMTLCEWFEPTNPKHVYAYQHLQRVGTWPEGFVPDGIEIPHLWFMDITQQLANRWMKHVLIENRCRYCGGNCAVQPDDSNNMCDGFAGDIDGLYGGISHAM